MKPKRKYILTDNFLMNRFKYIFISIMLISILPQCKKYEINNAGYAIGTIDWYERQVLWKKSAEISYTFIVNGTEYFNQYENRQWGKEFKVPALKNYNKGDEFMVQYDKTNLGGFNAGHQSRMLFDYAVKDSSDYRRYVAEFLTNPPK